jgi:hypothetical protein
MAATGNSCFLDDRMKSDGKSSHCLWQGELKNIDKNNPIAG